MSDQEPRPFEVETKPAKSMVVGSLTKDVTVDACIFDLIDNSVDAAREHLAAKNQDAPADGLPRTYTGYRIELKINGSQVQVRDNCGGMNVDAIRETVLRFGERSHHPYGIGTYGVGLNRAIFKLGASTKIETNDGNDRSVIAFDHAAYLASDDWKLPAYSVASLPNAKLGTTVDIKGPPPQISSTLADPVWSEGLVTSAQYRYHDLLKKGLVIKVNGDRLAPADVPTIGALIYGKTVKEYWIDPDVHVRIEGGRHIHHRFANKDPDHDWNRARELTDQYGWNIVCNDRLIVVSDRTMKTGYTRSGWHPEHNGFVGYVRLTAKNPEKLPWNSTKTDIDVNHPLYKGLLKTMADFAEQWRRFARKVGKTKGFYAEELRCFQEATAHSEQGRSVGAQYSPEQSQAAANASSKPAAGKPKPNGQASPKDREDHLQWETVIPSDVAVGACSDKVLRLVNEAKSLRFDDFRYTGLLLIRTIFELAAVDYLRRNGKFRALRSEHFQKANAERKAKGCPPLSEEQKASYAPSFDQICNYFLTHPDVWGISDFTYTKHLFESLKGHKPMLNSVAHSPAQLVGPSLPKEIQAIAVPLLRHLLADPVEP